MIKESCVKKILLKNHQSPGDIIMLTSAVRDLKAAQPTKKSIYWKEIILPNRTTTSTSKPVGIKFLGDNWFNPITNLIYTYTKNNGQYLWLSY